MADWLSLSAQTSFTTWFNRAVGQLCGVVKTGGLVRESLARAKLLQTILEKITSL